MSYFAPSFCSIPYASQLCIRERIATRRSFTRRTTCISARTDNAEDNQTRRRDILVGLGGVYGATALNYDPLAFAKPIAAPHQRSSCADMEIPANVFQDRGKVALAAGGDTPAAIPISSFPIVLDRVVTTSVPRPKKSRSKKEKEEEEEVLVIKGIEFERDEPVKFDVYVNEGATGYGGPETTEFAGSFVNIPQKNTKGKKKTKTKLKLGLTDLLEELGIDDDDSVLVSLVPKYNKGKVKIDSIKIALVKD